MEKKIEQILEDLYALDEGFKQDEKKLRKIIGDLILTKPDIKISDNFVQELRTKLSEEALVLEEENQGFSKILGYFKILNRLPYMLGGATFLLLVGLFLGTYFAINSGKVNIPPQSDAGNISVTQLKEGAFGSLAGLSSQKSEQELANDSGGGAASSQSASAMMSPAFREGGASGISIMPEIMNYKYIYRGGDFSVPADKMPVYKNVESSKITSFAEILAKFNFSEIDLQKFSGAKLEYLTLAEDREFGYILNISFKEGLLSIYKNWEKWPIGGGQCKGDVCIMTKEARPEIYPAPGNDISLADMPSDEEILAIAEAFLKDYGVNTSGYGQGKVQNFAGRLYMAESSGSAMPSIYIPEEVAVVYPYVIDGKTVFDQSGNEIGLTIGVDIRYKKVSYLSNLRTSKYESSLYETETDSSKIIEAAEKGFSYYYGEDSVKTAEISLGTPFLGLSSMWQYNQESGRSYELYVPAFIFPILQKPDNFYIYQNNVVVPIAKELMRSNDYIEPLPLKELPVNN